MINKSQLALYSLFIALLFSSCQSKQEKLQSAIASAEKELYGDKEKLIPDRDKALKLIEMYREYADTYSSDTTADEYLYKAADLANGLHESALAIKLYESFCKRYPNHEKAPVAFFLRGFIYENHLSNLGEAKTVYGEFLEKYPDHALAKDVQFSLDNLGKSPEELIRQFEEKQKADSLALQSS